MMMGVMMLRLMVVLDNLGIAMVMVVVTILGVAAVAVGVVGVHALMVTRQDIVIRRVRFIR
jgi:hypothetical protein